ncbi:MAG TPA: zf-HC2 domain-containing protein [Phycisphaerae bacterium]|nr:zf-HC2 domain-containing protein [Phycisphaerae bacterium]
MNTCEQASRLSAYHDGEMSPDCRVEFERHLGQCPQCAAELDRLRRLTAMLGAARPAAIPAASLARLHRAVDLLPTTGIRRLAEALAGVAAAILLVCMIGLARRSDAPAATASMPVWETQAVAQQQAVSATATSDVLLASWMVQDLSGRSEHD